MTSWGVCARLFRQRLLGKTSLGREDLLRRRDLAKKVHAYKRKVKSRLFNSCKTKQNINKDITTQPHAFLFLASHEWTYVRRTIGKTLLFSFTDTLTVWPLCQIHHNARESLPWTAFSRRSSIMCPLSFALRSGRLSLYLPWRVLCQR